jgi:hypothetical protein
MEKIVGVKSYFDLTISKSLKREALFFEKIAIPGLDTLIPVISKTPTGRDEAFEAELDFLLAKEIIFDPKSQLFEFRDAINDEFNELRDTETDLWKEIIHLNKEKDVDAGNIEIMARAAYAAQINTRMTTIKLREKDGMDAYSVFHFPTPPGFMSPIMKKSDVVDIIVNALPMPDALTSWEHILDYRSDPDSKTKFLALRNWINDLARSDLNANEIEEKLEYLIQEYENHLQVHKMKNAPGPLETTVVATGELLENVLKLKIGSLAKSFFGIKQRRAELLEAELKARGREVSYILKARTDFLSSA